MKFYRHLSSYVIVNVMMMAVNALSAQRLIRSLDPLFRLSDGARLVFLSDGNATSQRPFWAAYAASKNALAAIASALRRADWRRWLSDFSSPMTADFTSVR